MEPTRRPSIALLSVATAVALPASALAGGDDRPSGHHGGGPVTTMPAPATIALPDGWQPEGIAAGPGGRLYVGSIPTGAVYRADPRSGTGSVLVPGKTGRAATGLKIAGDKIVVSGASTGHAYVYDAKTGADVADITLTTGTSFINDVAISGKNAYFTDSKQQQLYRVSLASSGHGRGHDDDHGPHARGKGGKGRHHVSKFGHGGPSKPATTPSYSSTTVPITGAFAYTADTSDNDANGIVALRGNQLLVVQSSTGKLFKVDGTTGVSVQVPVSGGDLTNGDGLLLEGDRLYVVQNRLNQIAVVGLDRGATAGTIERTITNPAFRVPTTLASVGRDLFAVNARFGTPATPTTDYDIVRFAN